MKSNGLRILIFIVLTSVFSNAEARGGNSGSGGGHTVSCIGQPTVTLDFFNASLASSGDVINPDQTNVENLIVERLQLVSEIDVEAGKNPRDYIAIDRKRITQLLKDLLAKMGAVDSWPDRDLKIIGDHRLIYNLSPNCDLEQAAAQDEDGRDTRFFRNSKVTGKLSLGQKSLLRVHEALYKIYRGYLGIDSKAVRNFLEAFLLANPKNESLIQALENFMHELRTTGNTHLCEAQLYRGDSGHPMGIYNIRPLKNLRFYGRTFEEAAAKMPPSRVSVYILCNRFQMIEGGRYKAICQELASPRLNCRAIK